MQNSGIPLNNSDDQTHWSDTGDKPFRGTVYYVINMSASAILLMIIFCGNCLILYLVVKRRGQQTSANSAQYLLISGMALHDLITGVALTPIHIVNVLELEHVTNMACLASNIPTFTVHIVSGYTPLLLALERFLFIIYPFKYPTLVTERKVKVSLVLLWTYGLFVGCLPLLGWNNINNTTIDYCHVEHFVDGRYLGFMYLGNVVPCMIGQVVLYAMIIHTAQRQAKRIDVETKSCSSQPSTVSTQKPDRRGLLVLALSSSFFIVSYLPVILETAIDFKLYTCKALVGSLWSSVLFSIGDIMILTNAAINPLFYAYSNRNFRARLTDMFKRSNR